MEGDEVPINLPHHIRQTLCTTRALYRQGKKLTAVKVYTVNDESRHLLLFKVPALGLQNELKELCERFGEVDGFYKLVANDQEEFTETYHIRYVQIKQARYAKKQLDDRSFYGGILHTCYAPEMETVEDTRNKLVNRRREIAYYTGRTSSASCIPNQKEQADRNKKNAYPFFKTTVVPKSFNFSSNSKTNKELPIHDIPSTSKGVVDPNHQYPSQKVLELPGSTKLNSMKSSKLLIPSSVIKRRVLDNKKPTPKIIFHNKTN